MIEKGRSGEEKRRRRFANRPPYHALLLFFISLVCFVGNSSAQDHESIRSGIASPNSELKRNALFQIINLHSEAASRLAIPALTDKDLLVRATAANAVIYIPKPEAASVLRPLLNDKMEFVRGEAAFALGEVGDSSATAALLRILEKDSRFVKAAAATALGKIGDISAVGPLADTFRAKPNEENEFLRRCAAHAIGLIAESVRKLERTVTTPENFLPDKYKKGVSQPRVSVRFAGFSSAITTLVGVLHNEKEADDTRREAAFALGAIGDLAAVPELRMHLNSPDNYLAEICKEALLRIELQK